MKLAKEIVIKLQVEGLHHWPECDVEGVEFLKDKHRHVFHIECNKQVSHSDRDIEIIKLKRQMEDFLYESFATIEGQPRVCDFDTMSCEMIGELMVSAFKLSSCLVTEDNENGACIIATEDHTDTSYSDPSKAERSTWSGYEIEASPMKGEKLLFVNDFDQLPLEFDESGIYFCPDVIQNDAERLNTEVPILLSKGKKITIAARPKDVDRLSPYAHVHCHIMLDIGLHGLKLKPTDTIKVETDFYTTHSAMVKDMVSTKPENYAHDEEA